MLPRSVKHYGKGKFIDEHSFEDLECKFVFEIILVEYLIFSKDEKFSVFTHEYFCCQLYDYERIFKSLLFLFLFM